MKCCSFDISSNHVSHFLSFTFMIEYYICQEYESLLYSTFQPWEFFCHNCHLYILSSKNVHHFYFCLKLIVTPPQAANLFLFGETSLEAMPGAGRTFATSCNILPFWHKAGILGQFEFEHSAVYSTVCNCAWRKNFLLSLVPHLIIWVAANVPLQSFFDWNQCTGSNWRKIMKCQTTHLTDCLFHTNYLSPYFISIKV